MKKYFLIALGLLVIFSANIQAATYHQVIIDGTNDFVIADELCVDDPADDSAWTPGNELDNLYITWDANNLYFGVDLALSGNTLDIWFAANDGSSVTSERNIGWGRYVTFQGWNPDYVIHYWQGGSTDFIQLIDNSTSTFLTSGSSFAPWAEANYFEVSIPWTEIGFQVNQEISVAVTITGGPYDACDAMPAQTVEPNGDGVDDVIDVVYTVNCDTNGDGTPEDNWDPSTNSAISAVVDWDLF